MFSVCCSVWALVSGDTPFAGSAVVVYLFYFFMALVTWFLTEL